MRPLDFYRFAQDLSERATDSAAYRSVVSRAYYGMHHEACCRYFRKEPYAPAIGMGSRHTDLCNRLNDPTDPQKATLASLLSQLQHARAEADYVLDEQVKAGRAFVDCGALMRYSLKLCEQLVRALERYSPGEAPDGCLCKTVRSSVSPFR